MGIISLGIAWHDEDSSLFFWKDFKMSFVRSINFQEYLCQEHGITFLNIVTILAVV